MLVRFTTFPFSALIGLLTLFAPSSALGQEDLGNSLNEITARHLKLKYPDSTLVKTPTQRYGLALYAGQPARESKLTALEREVRRRMHPSGDIAKQEFARRIQAAKRSPGDLQSVFTAFVSALIRREQQYERGESLDAYETSSVTLPLALLLSATKTRDPLALSWLLTFELDPRSTNSLSLRDQILVYGREWLKRYPEHLELRRAIAFALADRRPSPMADEGDRLLGQLIREYPNSLFLATMPAKIATYRFNWTRQPEEGRRALKLLRELRVRFPVGSYVRTSELPQVEGMVLRLFKDFGLTP